ncbi:MAG TPA: rhomboid family intramembrane serine protease [Candidatus Limnocylindrales bacterium]|jgi:membrane associated rhomboid family serine protease
MLNPSLDAAVASTGPLSPEVARALLDRARELLDAGEPSAAAAHFQRVIGSEPAAVTAEAWLGLGDSLYRMDREPEAVAAWEAATKLPETPSTYRAWRQIAGARVRVHDLAGATRAYREAERRAPSSDRPEIASRLGWLAKEQGQAGTARRYFARSRGDTARGLAMIVLVVTVVVSLAALLTPDTTIFDALVLDRADVDRGELWRLLSVTLLHANFIHLALNMYALYLIGPVVEQIWGSRLFAAFYLLTAIAASTASIVFTDGPAVGASGAIFGLVGVLLAGTRVHHPMLDQRARQIVPQLGMLVVINLVFGFVAVGIDNAAHVGGLVAGLWLGLVVPPGRAPTLRSFWQHPGGQPAQASPLVIVAGVLILVAAILLGLSLAGLRL